MENEPRDPLPPPTKLEQARNDLLRRRFRFLSRTVCCVCKNKIEWWRTSRGKVIPMTAANLVPHWDMCEEWWRNHKPATCTPLIKPYPGRW